MAVEVNGTAIRMPQGDTGIVRFLADSGDLTADDRGVFTLARRDGTPMLRKLIDPDIADKSFSMAFVWDDTVNIKPGVYEWSFRVVRSGTFESNGRLLSTQRQDTVLGGKLTVQAVAGGVR